MIESPFGKIIRILKNYSKTHGDIISRNKIIELVGNSKGIHFTYNLSWNDFLKELEKSGNILRIKQNNEIMFKIGG